MLLTWGTCRKRAFFIVSNISTGFASAITHTGPFVMIDSTVVEAASLPLATNLTMSCSVMIASAVLIVEIGIVLSEN